MKNEVIILTKSIKRGGYCVAGIDANTGEWIRIVSDDEYTEHAVLDSHMRYSNGNSVNIFDIVRIDFIEHVPIPVQPENWLFNDSVAWTKTGQSSLKEVLSIHPYENPDYIFYNTDKAVSDDYNFPRNHSSLILVKVPYSQVFIKTFERKKFNYNFTYNGRRYQYISITDEDIRNRMNDKIDGLYPCRPNLPVVFSLADTYEGKYYKIAAQFLSGI